MVRANHGDQDVGNVERRVRREDRTRVEEGPDEADEGGEDAEEGGDGEVCFWVKEKKLVWERLEGEREGADRGGPCRLRRARRRLGATLERRRDQLHPPFFGGRKTWELTSKPRQKRQNRSRHPIHEQLSPQHRQLSSRLQPPKKRGHQNSHSRHSPTATTYPSSSSSSYSTPLLPPPPGPIPRLHPSSRPAATTSPDPPSPIDTPSPLPHCHSVLTSPPRKWKRKRTATCSPTGRGTWACTARCRRSSPRSSWTMMSKRWKKKR